MEGLIKIDGPIRPMLTGSLSRVFGVEDREWVVGVKVRLKEGHRHGPHQGRQALPQCWKMSVSQHANYHGSKKQFISQGVYVKLHQILRSMHG